MVTVNMRDDLMCMPTCARQYFAYGAVVYSLPALVAVQAVTKSTDLKRCALNQTDRV